MILSVLDQPNWRVSLRQPQNTINEQLGRGNDERRQVTEDNRITELGFTIQ